MAILLPWSRTLALASILPSTQAFVWTTPASSLPSSSSLSSCHRPTKQTCSALGVLTERQMQFWEDVEDGLNDMEAFYAKRGQNIDRIREFGKRARGEIPLEGGYADGQQPSEEHISNLTARAFWDVVQDGKTAFPWARILEENSNIIVQEFDNKIQKDQRMFSADSVWQNQVMGEGWSAFRLQRLGVWNTENCKEFPKTYELLRDLDIPFAVRGVCFARQTPGSGVQPHSDGRNFILTAHLGLKVPPDCWMKVGNEVGGWTEGKLTILDTSFVHSTGNPSNEDRHVLIIDFWHPDLTEAERAALEFVYDLRNRFENGFVPYRKPKAVGAEADGVGAGIGGWWKRITG